MQTGIVVYQRKSHQDPINQYIWLKMKCSCDATRMAKYRELKPGEKYQCTKCDYLVQTWDNINYNIYYIPDNVN